MTHRKLCPDCGTKLTLVATSHDSGMWVDEGTNEFHECRQSLRRQLAEANKRAERAEELAFAYDQTRSPMSPTHKRLLEELEQLRAIVARLPRTADGVPVVPGRDTVWNWLPRGLHSKCSWVECAVEIRQPYNEAMYDYVDISEVGKCYSTREAAEAATGKP